MVMVPQAAEHIDEAVSTGAIPPLPVRHKKGQSASRKHSRDALAPPKSGRGGSLTPQGSPSPQRGRGSSPKSATLDRKAKKEAKQARKKARSKSVSATSKR